MKKYAILLSFLLPFASVGERAMPIQDGKLITPLNANSQSITNLPSIKFTNGTEFDGTPASVGLVGTNEFVQATNGLQQAILNNSNRLDTVEGKTNEWNIASLQSQTNKSHITSLSNSVDSAFAQIETNRQHIALTSNAVVVIQGRTNEYERIVKDAVTNNQPSVTFGGLNLGYGYLENDNVWGMKWKFAGDADTVEMNQAETAWKFNIGGGGVTRYRFNATKNGFGPILDLNTDGSARLYGPTTTSNLTVNGTITASKPLKINYDPSLGSGSWILEAVSEAVTGGFRRYGNDIDFRCYKANVNALMHETTTLGIWDSSSQEYARFTQTDKSFSIDGDIRSGGITVAKTNDPILITVRDSSNRWNSAYAQSQTNKTNISALSNEVAVVKGRTNAWEAVTTYAVRSNSSGRVNIGITDDLVTKLNVKGNIKAVNGRVDADFLVAGLDLQAGRDISAFGSAFLGTTLTVGTGFTLGDWLYSDKTDGTRLYAPVGVNESVGDPTITTTSTSFLPTYILMVTSGENASVNFSAVNPTFQDQSFQITVWTYTTEWPFSVNEYLVGSPSSISSPSDYSTTPFGLDISWTPPVTAQYPDELNPQGIMVEVVDTTSWSYYYYDVGTSATSLSISDFSGANYFSWPFDPYVYGIQKYSPSQATYESASQGFGLYYGNNYNYTVYAAKTVFYDGNYYELLSTIPATTSTYDGSYDTQFFIDWEDVSGAEYYVVEVYDGYNQYYRTTPNTYVTDYGDYGNYYSFPDNVTWTQMYSPITDYGFTMSPLAFASPALVVYDKNLNKRFEIDGSTGSPAFKTPNGYEIPFSVDSQTKVDNLNADLLDGNDSSAFQPAGNYATPSTVTQIVNAVVITNFTSPSLEVSLSSGSNSMVMTFSDKVKTLYGERTDVTASIQTNGDIRVSGRLPAFNPLGITSNSVTGVQSSSLSVIFSDGTNVLLGAGSITIGMRYSTDGGLNFFSPATTTPNYTYNATRFKGEYYVLCRNAGVYKASSVAGPFNIVLSSAYNSSDGAITASDTRIVMGNPLGLFSSTNGTTWVTHSTLSIFYVSKLTDRLIATTTTAGTALESFDEGATWRTSEWASFLPARTLRIRDNRKYMFFTAYDNNTLFRINKKTRVRDTVSGIKVSSVSPIDTVLANEALVFFASYSRTIDGFAISTDGGDTFTETANTYYGVANFRINDVFDSGGTLRLIGGANTTAFRYNIPLYSLVNYTVARNPMQPPRWADVIISGIALRNGATSPTRKEAPVGSGIFGTGFNVNDDSDFAGQAQHGVASTNANFLNFYYNPHGHVSATSVIAPTETNATFVLTWQIAPVGSNYLGSSISRTSTVSWTVGETNFHKMVSFGIITNNALQGADSLVFRGNIKRIATPVIGNDISESASSSVIVDSLDYHFPFDNYGSISIFGDAP